EIVEQQPFGAAGVRRALEPGDTGGAVGDRAVRVRGAALAGVVEVLPAVKVADAGSAGGDPRGSERGSRSGEQRRTERNEIRRAQLLERAAAAEVAAAQIIVV